MSGGGGSKSSGPTTQTVNQNNIPEYVRPYYETLLGQSQALTNINQNPYQAYQGQRVADFSPMQEQAFGQLENMQLPGQTVDASNQAYNNYQQGQQYQNYVPQQFQNQYSSPQFQGMGVGSLNVQAPQNLQNFNIQGAQNQWNQGNNVGTGQWTDPNVASSYMSPYIQNALTPALNQMQRQSDIRQRDLGGQAQQAGAFGGYRHGLQQAEEQRNTERAKSDMTAQMMNQGYGQAGQLFGTDSARALQAAQGNQGMGMQSILANQNAQQQARLANQQGQYGLQALGSGYGMQAQQLNQGANLQAQNLGMQQNLAGNAQNLANAQNYAQFGMQGQQLGEQSRQFGGNLGLQGLAQQLQASGLLGNLGQMQYGQQLGLNQAQQLAGAQQQNQVQQQLSNQYQDFLDEQNWAYKNIGFMSDIIGRPAQQTSTSMYQAAPSTSQNLMGLGLGAYGLSGMMSGGKKAGGIVHLKKGGEVKEKDPREGTFFGDEIDRDAWLTINRRYPPYYDKDTGAPYDMLDKFIDPRSPHKGKKRRYHKNEYAGGGAISALPEAELAKIAQQANTFRGLLANQQMQHNQQIRTAQPPSPESQLPPMSGVAQLPAPNMQFAEGGVVGYADGGRTSSGAIKNWDAPPLRAPRTPMDDEIEREAKRRVKDFATKGFPVMGVAESGIGVAQDLGKRFDTWSSGLFSPSAPPQAGGIAGLTDSLPEYDPTYSGEWHPANKDPANPANPANPVAAAQRAEGRARFAAKQQEAQGIEALNPPDTTALTAKDAYGNYKEMLARLTGDNPAYADLQIQKNNKKYEAALEAAAAIMGGRGGKGGLESLAIGVTAGGKKYASLGKEQDALARAIRAGDMKAVGDLTKQVSDSADRKTIADASIYRTQVGAKSARYTADKGAEARIQAAQIGLQAAQVRAAAVGGARTYNELAGIVNGIPKLAGEQALKAMGLPSMAALQDDRWGEWLIKKRGIEKDLIARNTPIILGYAKKLGLPKEYTQMLLIGGVDFGGGDSGFIRPPPGTNVIKSTQ
jgi:hypothetical protein